jgi:hypothetical protein
MSDEKKPTSVTRAELYPVLGSVYLLIAIALLGLVRTDDQSILRVIGYFLMFGVAIASSFTFSILGMRERRLRKWERSGLADQGAAQDRPRD